MASDNSTGTIKSLDDQLIAKQGFILQINVYIRSSDMKTFMDAFRPIHDIVLPEEECVFFVFGSQELDEVVENEDGSKITKFSWTEGWNKSVEWFMTSQMTKDYYTDYLKLTEAMFVKPREVSILSPHAGLSNFKTY